MKPTEDDLEYAENADIGVKGCLIPCDEATEGASEEDE